MGLMQLAGTYEGGWERLMGRQPTPDDLLIPSNLEGAIASERLIAPMITSKPAIHDPAKTGH